MTPATYHDRYTPAAREAALQELREIHRWAEQAGDERLEAIVSEMLRRHDHGQAPGHDPQPAAGAR